LVILNFFSRGYGDTIANMLAGNFIYERSNNGIISHLPGILKVPEFYDSTIDQQREIWKRLEDKKIFVIPAHRQRGFDYRLLCSDLKVISIVPDLNEPLARRVIAIDVWEEKNIVLKQLRNKLSLQEKVKYTANTIKKWADVNILDSDIKIPMSNLGKLQELNFSFNQTIINDLYTDLEQYKSNETLSRLV